MNTMPTTGAMHIATVIDRRECARDVVVLGFDAPDLVRETRPGSFVMVVPPSGETSSVALGVYEADGRRASLLFFVVGKRTRELERLQVGDALALSGPLGNGFTIA